MNRKERQGLSGNIQAVPVILILLSCLGSKCDKTLSKESDENKEDTSDTVYDSSSSTENGNKGKDSDTKKGDDDTVSHDSEKVEPSWPLEKYVTADDLYVLISEENFEMVLLNVVDEDFYYLGHIANSLVIPWDELEGRTDELGEAEYVVVYCRRGVRSDSAWETLTDAGYQNLIVLEGGIEAWTEAGYEVVEHSSE